MEIPPFEFRRNECAAAKGAHSETSVIQQADGLGGGVSGQRLPSGIRRAEVVETADVSTNWGILTEAAASFGCDETINPGDSESPHGHLRASVVEAFFFWQQLSFAGEVSGSLKHPQED